MKNLEKRERTALATVASNFSATWETGDGFADAYLAFAGKRIPVDITTLHPDAKPHLRFDKVATRLMERLKTAAGETVPDGITALVTVTAPIRLPSKTAASVADKIQALLVQGPLGSDERETIQGNQVVIRLFRHGSHQVPKLIGFGHNPDSDPLQLLNMSGGLLELISLRRSMTGDRWLLVITSGERSSLDLGRYIFSQLGAATGFQKILMASGNCTIEVLRGF
jgi:hypothetical protein